MLTNEQIKDCLDAADQMYCTRDGDKEIFNARAIEYAACAERDMRIAELERLRSEDHAHAIDMAIDIERLKRQLEEARKQMESQKDEWLSWEAKRKALEKDAERYRWLRANWFTMTSTYHNGAVQFYTHSTAWLDQSPDTIDSAIDAAMKSTP